MENQIRRKIIEYLYNIKNTEDINLNDKETINEIELNSIINEEINITNSKINLNNELTEDLFSVLKIDNSETSTKTYNFKYAIFFLLPLILGFYFISNTNQKIKLNKVNSSNSDSFSLKKKVTESFSFSEEFSRNNYNDLVDNKNSIAIKSTNRRVEEDTISINKANNNIKNLITKTSLFNTDLDYDFQDSKIEMKKINSNILTPTTSSNFSIMLSSVHSISDNNSKLENSLSGLINNFKIGISYDVSNYLCLGLDFSQETFFLRYSSRNNEFQTNEVEQYTNTSSINANLKVKYPIENELIAPYAKVSSGLNRFGITNRAAIGLELNVFNNSKVFVEFERNQMRFEHQNNTFSSFNNSINMGIISPLTLFGKIL